jgi:hypothetical protein
MNETRLVMPLLDLIIIVIYIILVLALDFSQSEKQSYRASNIFWRENRFRGSW